MLRPRIFRGHQGKQVAKSIQESRNSDRGRVPGVQVHIHGAQAHDPRNRPAGEGGRIVKGNG